jgi:hypothetical protein
MPDGSTVKEDAKFGDISYFLEEEGGESGHNPAKTFDLGAGRARRRRRLSSGIAGVLLDARGRPLIYPEDAARRDLLYKWFSTLKLYPEDPLKELVK